MFYFVNMIYGKVHTPRVEQKRQRKIDRILDCAMVLLAESGLEGVTIQSIAEAMELTVGALYRYFPSKVSILAAMTQRTVLELAEALKVNDDPAADVKVRLLSIAEAHIAFSRSHPAHFLLISQMMTSPKIILPPEERASAMMPAFDLIAFVERVIVDGQRQGALQMRDPRALALMFWSAVQGALQLDKFARLDPTEMHRENVASQVAQDLLSAWSQHVD